jgi:hypothetical protein
MKPRCGWDPQSKAGRPVAGGLLHVRLLIQSCLQRQPGDMEEEQLPGGSTIRLHLHAPLAARYDGDAAG